MLTADRVIGHKEYGNTPPGGWKGRKQDPVYDMALRRRAVAGFRPRNAGFAVSGAIAAAYNRVLPGLNGATWAFFLGAPTGPAVVTWGKDGYWQQFKKGTIYAHAGRAHAVWGAILTRFWALGAEPVMGYPVSDELACPDLVGRMSHFKGGPHGDSSIYWTPTTGAHPVWGLFRVAWAAAGWERGPWGYPTSGEHVVAGVLVQDFQGGRVSLVGGKAVFAAIR